MRILVCGGRDYHQPARVCHILTAIHKKCGITEIIHGGASGADECAGVWARSFGIKETAVPADWKTHGKRAGPLRNQLMLKMHPDGVVAFPGGRGTADMVRRSEAAGIRVMRVDWEVERE